MALSVELRFGELFLSLEQNPTETNFQRLITFVQNLVTDPKRQHPIHLTPSYAENVVRALLRLAGRQERKIGGLLKITSEISLHSLYLLAIEVPEVQDALVGFPVTSLSTVRFDLHIFEGSNEDHKAIALKFVILLRKLSPKFKDLHTYVRRSEEVKQLLKDYDKDEKAAVQPAERRRSAEGFIAPQSGAYYDVPVPQVLKAFGTDANVGLTTDEVYKRRQEYGPNELPKAKPRPWWKILFQQLAEFMVLVLVAAAVASAAVGEYKGAVTLAIVIVINTVIGFVQEYKAERALNSLMSLEVPRATVIRDGEVAEIPAVDLVPGDVVSLDEGNAIPADLRLFEAINLDIIESVLTGESDSVHKHTEPILKKDIPIGDRKNMAYMSTTVVKGRGKGIVITTGIKTEAGKISEHLAKAKQPQTPLQRRLGVLGKWLVFIAGWLCGLIIAIGLIQGKPVQPLVLLAVSLGVSVIPEGLATVVVVTMALGVRRMAKKNAIVRRLAAVETLGSVSTICSDKTGTLTEGKMRATTLWLLEKNRTFEITGSGTEPVGEFMIKNSPIDPKVLIAEESAEEWKPLRTALETVSLCNNSAVQKDPESGGWERIGDPTEVALMLAAMKMEFGKTDLLGAAKKKEDDSESKRKKKRKAAKGGKLNFSFVSEVAFDSNRKRMSVVYKDNDTGDYHIYVKGGLESVMSLCTTATTKQQARIEKMSLRLGKEGLRVLTLAYRHVPASDTKTLAKIDWNNESDVESSLVFVGLIGLIDPPRKEVAAAIAKCYGAGIRVCMITGDHQVTASSIADKLGIVNPYGRAMRGVEIDLLAQEQALESLEPVPCVFARVSPENKLQIVEALQARREVVAMTGDGVNDAPAIKKSDVGVAMGISGTDITKSAASIVLRDDNFDTIARAVEEGRVIYDNIQKFILYLLSCNSAEIFLVLLALIIGEETPMTTIQILWANIIADVPPAMALGIDPAEPDVMSRPPRPPEQNILTPDAFAIIGLHGLDMCLLALASYFIALYPQGYKVPISQYGAPVDQDNAKRQLNHAQTAAWATLTAIQLFHGLLARSKLLSVFQVGLLRNKWMLGAISISFTLLVAGIYIPGLNTLLELYPLDGWDWLKIFVAIACHFVISEFGKLILRSLPCFKVKKRVLVDEEEMEAVDIPDESK